MSKPRISDESRIVHFFTTAPFAKVDVVFNIIAPIVKQRRAQEPELMPLGAESSKPRRKRRSKQPSLPLAEVAS